MDNTSDMKVETDLKKIKEIAQKKEDENWEFRSFLKGYDIKVEELDSITNYALKIAGHSPIFIKRSSFSD